MNTITLDIETTGIPAKHFTYEKDFMEYPYILSMAWKINDQQISEFIINQEGRLIPPEATKINGITDEMATNSPHTLPMVLRNFILDSSDSNLIIGHNIYFDTSIIKANVLRSDRSLFDDFTSILHKDKRIDTMRICHKLLGGKWPTLSEVHRGLFGTVPNVTHSAGADVDTTYKIYLELVKRGLALGAPLVVVEEENE